MKLLSDYLPEKYRSAVRFVVIGLTGTVVQKLLWNAAEWGLGNPTEDSILGYVAWGIGFVLEMIPNFFFSCWYTFETRPSLKRAGEFLLARAINMVIQFGFLPLLIWLMSILSVAISEDVFKYAVIVLAGIINYFVLLFFFKKKKTE